MELWTCQGFAVKQYKNTRVSPCPLNHPQLELLTTVGTGLNR